MMELAQKGLCAICGKPASGGAREKRLFVDHRHSTGEIRELLCHNCNSGLGYFFENPEVLRAAIAYVEKHSR